MSKALRAYAVADLLFYVNGSHGISSWRIPFFFFSREETRMHVHVAHTDGEAKYWLEPKIELAVNQGLSRQQVNEASSLVRDHYEEIVHAWHDHFGR